MYISYFVMYIYHLWKKLEARLGVAYDFGNVWDVWKNKVFWKKELDYIQYAQNNVCHSYAVILARSAALLDLRRLGFRGMFDSPGFAMFDRIWMFIFVFYYIYNDYENLVSEKDAFCL